MTNKPTVSFADFLKNVDDMFLQHQASRSNGKISASDQWRYGQTIMNVLHDTWHEKYNQITNTHYDCFFTNANVKSTLEKLEKEWHE